MGKSNEKHGVKQNVKQQPTNNMNGGTDTTEKKELPPTYDNTADNFGGKLVNTTYYIGKMLLYYVKNYKMEFGFLLGLLVYIITIIIVFTTNPYNIITENNGGVSIFLSMLGGFLIMMTFFFYLQKKQSTENVETAGALSYFGRLATTFVSFALVIAALYFIFYLASYYTNFSTYFLLGINALIIIGMITMAVKYFGIHDGKQSDSPPSWSKLLGKVITYIPCLLLDLVDYLKYQYQITTKPIMIVFLVELLLVGLYLIYPWIVKQFLSHNSNQLINEPTVLNNETNLGSFSDVNYVDDKFQYKYAVSGWIYIDSFPPETNSSYDEYTSLLNIGDKPNFLFNVTKNKLKIMLKTQDKNESILYETNEFRMQKWNHVIVNYDGATMDIFINNELVSSTPGTIPYNSNTMMTCGTSNGIYGGICNVNYFKEAISRAKITWLYTSVKNLNPPVI
jgi:hypothetical protein|tara:strand:- start:749 stop:2101 length:1353 start_codon:yes stop_codon:yes gene_type:complete